MGSFSTIGGGVTKLSELEIDTDLAMGAHNITLDDGKTVDGVDISQNKENLRQLIKQVHPTLQVLEVNDEVTSKGIEKIYHEYMLDCPSLTSYDEHNDNSIDTELWDLKKTGSYNSYSEANSEYLEVHANGSGVSGYAQVTSRAEAVTLEFRAKATGSYGATQIKIIGDSEHVWSDIPRDDTYRTYTVEKSGGNVVLKEDGVEKLNEPDTATRFKIRYYTSSNQPGETNTLYIDYTRGTDWKFVNGSALTGTISSNSAVLSFFKHLKIKVSNGGSTHTTPIQAEIYGDGDSYASPLNATTKFTIDSDNPCIELYREDVSEAAKSDAQTTWIMDDNATNGALPAKAGDKHATILAEEIGVASIIAVEKSVLGDFSDTVVLVEGDDYIVDYSNRKATKIILSDSAASDIVAGQSKLRITWIADVMNIDAATNNSSLKCKLYLNRNSTSEASPTIEPLDIGAGKYVELLYGT